MLDLPAKVAPARFVTIELASTVTGLSMKAIEMKIAKKVWREGREYRRAFDGTIWISLRGFESWVLGPVPVREARNAQASARRVALQQRTPAWADDAAIARLYEKARRKTEATGIAHHVDHVIPLLGRRVSGLHVHTNLRVIVGTENVRKGNRFEVRP